MNLYPTCDACKQTKFINDFRANGKNTNAKLCLSCAARTFDDSFECRECGDHERSKFWAEWAGSKFEAARLCHRCHFWHEKIGWKEANDPDQVIVGGDHFKIAPDSQTPGWGSGHGGSLFLIKFHDGREVLSRNLWNQGVIPERFRSRLPSNATFGTWHEARAAAGLPPLEFA